jgi:hypothetical protein
VQMGWGKPSLTLQVCVCVCSLACVVVCVHVCNCIFVCVCAVGKCARMRARERACVYVCAVDGSVYVLGVAVCRCDGANLQALRCRCVCSFTYCVVCVYAPT